MSNLRLRTIEVSFSDGSKGEARCEGNNAAWLCKCEDVLPLLGRCFPPDPLPVTVCPKCSRKFKLLVGIDERPSAVQEISN